ncbi:MAG TPA: ABC transporter permease [Steroidobacteraceae bacterium]
MSAQLREQPGRSLVTIIAIALGVALSAAVYLVNNAALNEFGLATKRLVGESDLIVRAAQPGIDEQWFVRLAKDPAVSVASPMLELEVAVAARPEPLKVLALDPFRAASIQPLLLADIGAKLTSLFDPDAIYVSGAAAEELKLVPGSTFSVTVGNTNKALHVVGVLSRSSYPESLGLMDIASAQWTLGMLGRLNRIDLQLKPGTDVEAFRRRLQAQLPAGATAIAPEVERDRALTVTRAYRINLNMLALVALWTGAFLVFSTQSLAALRRRRGLALLHALGVTRTELRRALVLEGALLGLAGSLLGILGGTLLATVIVNLLAGDLGNNALHAAGATFSAAPAAMLAFFAIGTAVAAVGSWFPARSAAAQSTAQALKGGDAPFAAAAGSSWRLGLMLLLAGVALTPLPAVKGLPLFGYAAIATLLLGAVLLVPALTLGLLKAMPRTQRTILDTAVAQLKQNVAQSTLSLASIIVSFSLMVAMAIMVYSFRVSFDHWLLKLLPADLQAREPVGNDTAFWSSDDQARLSSLPGISRAEFRRTLRISLDPDREPVALIARGRDARQAAAELPLVSKLREPGPGEIPVFISESFHDLYAYQLGEKIRLPLKTPEHYVIAGIWRDYVRPSGAIVLARDAYERATGDRNATEASFWLADTGDAKRVEAALRASLPGASALEVTTSSALRERSLRIFDRAFLVTYALDAVAVMIGLLGISFAASSTALARRAEFGMLRHIGMRRIDVMKLLASEGFLTSAFGVLYGLGLGTILSLVLVYVVNRQSFNWSIDLAIPVVHLALLSALLIGAAALTAVISGRAAMGSAAVRAVREDW